MVHKWVPPEKLKRGRPSRRRKQDIEEALSSRALEDGDWNDRETWNVRSDDQCQMNLFSCSESNISTGGNPELKP